jgi:predicted ATPase
VARASKREAAHDVFISYSSRDRARADAICAALEADGLRCWIVSRDGTPGASYAKFLVDAIVGSRIVVLVFSRNANRSEAVLNELEIAFSRGIAVLPVRIENVRPTDSAEFYLKRRHWFDAYDGFDAQLTRLAPAVRAALVPAPRTRSRRTVPVTAETAAPAPARGNLPRQETSFVGRTADVERIGELLRDARLTTIVGPGGVGKTRLALQVAEATATRPDGAWLVDLAPVEGDELVASTIMTALGAPQGGQASPLEQLVAYLANRRLLLLLDNCERKGTEVARVAASVLARCEHVTLLATSREPLNVAGEHTHRLASLDARDAARLFADRAKLVDPRFELSPSNMRVVDEICARLDGLALAIELAAARVRTISVDELFRRLTGRFRILTGGSRTALPHQQTMRALIDWSYDVLSDDEKTLFRRVAAFSGGFTLDAATAVCGDEAIDEWAIFDLLTALVDKSLVIADVDDTGQRYRQLQMIEEYAGSRLADSGERDARVAAHATYYAGVASDAYREWADVAQPGWLARLKPELENLRAALRWSLRERHDVALGQRLTADVMPVLLRLTLLSEAIAWSEAALVAEPAPPAAVEAQLHYGLAMLYNNQGSYDRAGAAAQHAVTAYARTDDARGQVRALSRLAVHDARQSRYDDAARNAADALERARTLGDRRLLAATLVHAASVFPPDHVERARERIAEATTLYRALGDAQGGVRALEWLAVAEGRAGQLDRAVDALLEALPLSDGDARIYVANNLACTLAALDDARALDAAREAFQLARDAHHAILMASAVVYLAAGSSGIDAERAARLFGYGRVRLTQLGWQPDNTDALIVARLTATLESSLAEPRLHELLARAASLSEDEVLAEAESV